MGLMSVRTGLLLGVGMLGACARVASPPPAAAQATAAASADALPDKPAGSRASGRSAPAAPQQGLRMFIDPVTGKPRDPTDAELAAEAARRATQPQPQATAVRGEPAEQIQLPNGMTEVRIGKQAEMTEVVCLQKDGSVGACPPSKAVQPASGAKQTAP